MCGCQHKTPDHYELNPGPASLCKSKPKPPLLQDPPGICLCQDRRDVLLRVFVTVTTALLKSCHDTSRSHGGRVRPPHKTSTMGHEDQARCSLALVKRPRPASPNPHPSLIQDPAKVSSLAGATNELLPLCQPSTISRTDSFT